MAKDAYYFPHDSNAQHDEKILQLRASKGWEGYGLYWAIIEKLRDSTDYRFSLKAIPGLAISLSHPQAELEAMLELCFNIQLLTKQDDFFHSESLTRRMEEVDAKRASLSEFGRRGGIASSQAKARLKPPSSNKVKESKVNKSKDVISVDNELKNVVKPQTKQQFTYERFCNRYQETTGKEYLKQWAKDQRLLKPVLPYIKSAEQWELTLDRYFSDSFAQGVGFTFGLLISQINKYNPGEINE